MRLAIPIWNDRISPVFDAAGRLLLVDIEQGRERARWEEVLSDVMPSHRMWRLAELGVNALICGGISRPLLTLLADSGISVFPWTAGPVDGDEEMIFTVPQGKLDDLMLGLRSIGKTGSKLPTGYSLFPEYPLPESYKKIAEMMGYAKL